MIVLIAFGFLFLLLIFGGIMAVIEEKKDEKEYSLWEVEAQSETLGDCVKILIFAS